MNIYYKLSNGELIEICTSDSFQNTIDIKLFGGSTVLTYMLDNNTLLNDILEEVEAKYNKLRIEDLDFEYRCYAD